MSPLSLDEDTRTHTHSSGTFDSCPPICGAPPGAQVLSLVFSLPTLHHASRTRHTHAQHVRCPPLPAASPCTRPRASLCVCEFVSLSFCRRPPLLLSLPPTKNTRTESSASLKTHFMGKSPGARGVCAMTPTRRAAAFARVRVCVSSSSSLLRGACACRFFCAALPLCILHHHHHQHAQPRVLIDCVCLLLSLFI